MEITYDQEADAMYFELRKSEFARNKKIDDFTTQKGTAHRRSQTGGMLASLGAVPLECQCFPPHRLACGVVRHRSKTGWKALCIIDLDEQENIIGIEFLEVSKRIPHESLAQVNVKNLLAVAR